MDLNSNQVQALPVTVSLPKQHKISLKTEIYTQRNNEVTFPSIKCQHCTTLI